MRDDIMIIAFSFLFGLVVGSFINVLAFRYKEGKYVFSRRALGGRSRCDHCEKVLSWYELLPLVSFIIQRGKCRNCAVNLSYFYPVSELVSGLFFAGVAHFFVSKSFGFFAIGMYGGKMAIVAAALIWASVFMVLLLIALIDYRLYLVPDDLVLVLFLLGAVWAGFLWLTSTDTILLQSFLGGYAALFGGPAALVWSRLLGCLVGTLVIAAIFFGSRGRAIGFGDVKLFAALGLLFGYPDVLLLLFLSFVFGAIFSVPLLIRRMKGMKDFVPFAPFAVISSFCVFLFGGQLLAKYFVFWSALLGL